MLPVPAWKGSRTACSSRSRFIKIRGNPGRNGSVITHVQVENVFWGASYADPSQDKPTADYLNTFMNYLVTSPFMNTLAQYGVGYGTFQGSITLTNVPTTGTISSYSDPVHAQPAGCRRKPPPVGPERALHGLHAPRCLDSGLPDITRIIGRLVQISRPGDGLLKYNDYFFAAIASPGPGKPNTVVASHELAEAVTDPRLDGWYTGQHERGRRPRHTRHGGCGRLHGDAALVQRRQPHYRAREHRHSSGTHDQPSELDRG